ncbi:MAG: hypothetical protein FWD81_06310 [Methanomassiliicoccaceae archaeon]|nr:hypothetical protein [Methanomassiliicoccaceae archaeon]
MRAAVRNLESLALGRDTVTDGDAANLSDRIVRKEMYDLMNAVFREKDAVKARRMMMDVDETPDHIMLWIDENMPREFADKGDLTRGYEKLARADVYMGRVSRRQYYRFWAYAGDMMSSGVNVSRRSNTSSHERFRFPMYLMKMSRSKSVRTVKKNICLKLSVMLHTSTSRISNDVLPSLKIMMRNDTELARAVVAGLELEASETAFLLDTKVDSKTVKELTSSKPAPEERETDIRAEQKVKKEAPPKAQKSLFQF